MGGLHLSIALLQEYLVACHLTDTDYPDLGAADLARQDPLRWREVALLAGAKAGRGAPLLFGRSLMRCVIVNRIWTRRPYLIFGARLWPAKPWREQSTNQIGERYRFIVERVARWLVAILTQNLLPAMERVLAGDLLSRLGGLAARWMFGQNGLPDIRWRDGAGWPIFTRKWT
ncbi:MAG: hypothetical protein U0401_28915 [Anaerolineae bacterium]